MPPTVKCSPKSQTNVIENKLTGQLNFNYISLTFRTTSNVVVVLCVLVTNQSRVSGNIVIDREYCLNVARVKDFSVSCSVIDRILNKRIMIIHQCKSSNTQENISINVHQAVAYVKLIKVGKRIVKICIIHCTKPCGKSLEPNVKTPRDQLYQSILWKEGNQKKQS